MRENLPPFWAQFNKLVSLIPDTSVGAGGTSMTDRNTDKSEVVVGVKWYEHVSGVNDIPQQSASR